MKITFVTVSTTAVKRLIESGTALKNTYPTLDLAVYYVADEMPKEKRAQMTHDLSLSDLSLVDLMGAVLSARRAVDEGLSSTLGFVIPYGSGAKEQLRLGALTAETLERMSSGKKAKMKSVSESAPVSEAGLSDEEKRDLGNYTSILRYFKMGDPESIENLLLLLLFEYGGIKTDRAIEAPRELSPVAIVHPRGRKAYDTFAEYRANENWDDARPTVAVLYYAHLYPTDTSGCVSVIVSRLEEKWNVLPIAMSGAAKDGLARLREILLEEVPSRPDVVLNFMSFRLGAGPMGGDAEAGTDLLRELDAPYLHPYFMSRRTVKEWEGSVQGCTSSEAMISVLMPELDGAIYTIPVGAMSEPRYDADFDVKVEELTVIDERVDRLTTVVENEIALRRKKNAEKRVALICYNYPPGEDNLFGGAFLDTFTSVSEIFRRLKKEGYTVGDVTKEDLLAHFTAGKAVNSGRYASGTDGMILYPVKRYTTNDEIARAWGKAPGDIMTEGGSFLIPGMISGNIFVGLQPARSGEGGEGASYHDKDLPPHHQYAAFYQWLREEFRADAVVHVGTHGTLEFLKGKEAGMSGSCYPDRLLGGIPHIYLYYCGNPAESTTAKRRSHALTVSYQPPVFVEGGLYGDHALLREELDNYEQAQRLSPQSAEDVLSRIHAFAEALQLPTDLEALEKELYRMEHSLIPRGLHVFGTPYTDEECGEYLLGLRNSFGGDVDENEIRENCRENREMQSLLDALSGKYIPARLAGDIYRNPSVLPAGYNLYQFDPKLVPTATAYERGKRIAENTLEAYKKDTGAYPTTVAVVLWGLETSRTQGETFAQILTYLGVRLVVTPRGRRYEIIPVKELGRPRIDVTVNICGFFRDMYPNLIDTLSDLFEQIASLDESDDENHLKANADRLCCALIARGTSEADARTLSVSRIFGPAEGQYGSGLTKFFQNHDWESEEQLGEVFTARVSHVYNRRMRGVPANGLYEEQLRCVDIVSQLRSSNEYEFTDLDHYFEYFGGLSKSVECAKGEKARMYVTDTAGKELLTETVDKSIARGVRTRVLNPKWIDGMLAHSTHGAQVISDRFENLMGLAATTGSVDTWIYDELDKKYVEDEEMRRRMKENNPHAYMKILEQMMEYSDRGYWDATEEQLERIRNCYLELENDLEGTI